MEIKVTVDNDVTEVKLNLKFNESLGAKLNLLRKQINTKKVVFDCEEANQINSTGASQWIGFLKDLTQTTECSFKNCSVEFMSFSGVIFSFTGKCPIHSFFVPYYCKDCKKDFLNRIETSPKVFNDTAREHKCPVCQKDTPPEVDWSEYVEFLRKK
jgi:hypothetical protein